MAQARKPSIGPGIAVEMILGEHDLQDAVRIFRAVVYDIEGQQVILSQTSPPLNRRHVGQPATVTFLHRQDPQGPSSRFGFTAHVSGILADYPLSSTQRVTAIVLSRSSAPLPANIRSHFRIRPRSDGGLSIQFGQGKTNLIDISLGGVQFNVEGADPIDPGATVRLDVRIDGKSFSMDARVVRTWAPEAATRPRRFLFVSAKFILPGREFEHLLGRKILLLERQMHAETAGGI